ncbi:MAG: rod shape-determining protein MreC [Planctomycetota bacterium]
MVPPAARLAGSLALLALGAWPRAEGSARAAAATAGVPLARFLSFLGPRGEAPPPPAPDEDPVRAFLLEEAGSLLPRDPALQSRRYLHASVVGREEEGSVLRLDAGLEDGAAPGAPAVLGEALLGVVEEASARECRVRTVLSSRFRAVGRVAPQHEAEEGASLVVAGTGGRFLTIAVSEGIDRVRAGDRVLCAAPPFPVEGEGVPGSVGAGFLLGFVEGTERGRATRVVPAADPARARALLLALGEGEEVRLSSAGSRDAAIAARAWERSEVAPGRRSILLSRGGRAGVRVGDAVAIGPRLLGFVASVGPWSCRALLLGDPGLVLPLSLRREGEGTVDLGEARPDGLGGFGTAPVGGPVRGLVHFSGEGIARGLLVGRGEVREGRLVLEPDLDRARSLPVEILPRVKR